MKTNNLIVFALCNVFINNFFHLKIQREKSILELMSSIRDPNNAQCLPNPNSLFDRDIEDANNTVEDFVASETETNFNCNKQKEISNEDIDMIDNDVEKSSIQNTSELNEDLNHEYEQHSIEPEDFRNLHENTNCTVIDLLCMIYAFSIRHNLTWEAVEDLMLLTNEVIGHKELIPSKYFFKKEISKTTNYQMVKHFFCEKCNLYIGPIDNVKRLNNNCCSNCNTQIPTDTKFKKNHFIAMPIKHQLQDVLERNSEFLNFDFSMPDNNICDVHHSIHFQNLREKMGVVPVITITFSTDGAARFKATKEKSVWPLQFFVNEVNLDNRFKRENVLCSAISFGKTPDMQIFFKPFMKEINEINTGGGLLFTMKNGQKLKVKIFPMIFTGDTPARADVLQKSYFNGYYGCSYCLHKGTLVNKQIRYCKRDDGPIRINEEVRADMLNAQENNEKINGYKGISPLTALKHFDVVWQVGIDKMHNIDLGVIALLFNLFLSSEYRKNRYL